MSHLNLVARRAPMLTLALVAAFAALTTPVEAQVGRGYVQPIQRNVVDPFNLPPGTEYSKDHIVVSYNIGVSEAFQTTLERRVGLELAPGHQSKYFLKLQLTSSAKAGGMTVEKAVRKMLESPTVRYAEFDTKLSPDFIPNDPEFGNLWGLHNTGQAGGTVNADINAPEAWDIAGNHPEVIVAVADDGYEFSHPDLTNVAYVNPNEIPDNGTDDDGNGFIDDVSGWDFSSDDNDANPVNGMSHGTHCSGTVGGEHNNGIGVSGVGPNIKIMPIRMYGSGIDWMTALANGVDYSAENGAVAISVSYNIDGYTQALVDAIGRAKTAGMAYINSAGNNNQNNPPRQQIRNIHDNVIFVASSTRNDTRSSFSNYGDLVEIFAPGSDILSTVVGGGYEYYSGTSMATPHVAGAYGVVAAMFPDLDYREVLDRLIFGGDQVPSLANFVPEGRRLNLLTALDDIPPTVGVPVVSVTPVIGSTLSGGITGFVAQDDEDMYVQSSVLVPGRGYYSAYDVVFDTGLTPEDIEVLKFELVATVDRGLATGYIYIWNYEAARFDLMRTTPIRTTPVIADFLAQGSKYVDADGMATVRVFTLEPLRTKGALSVTPYQLRTDFGQLIVNPTRL